VKSKNIISLSVLATLLTCFMLVSVATARETSSDVTPDPSAPADANLLIAPGPDENTTTSDGDTIYYSSGDNTTRSPDDAVPYGDGAADNGLILPNESASTPDNTLVYVAVGIVLVVVVGVGAVGVVFYRRSAAK
jgi:hypothetical protein